MILVDTKREMDEVAKQLSGGKWAVADSKFKAQRRDMAMRQIQAYNDQEFASQQEMEAQKPQSSCSNCSCRGTWIKCWQILWRQNSKRKR